MVYENAFNYTGDEWTDASVAILQAGGKLEKHFVKKIILRTIFRKCI